MKSDYLKYWRIVKYYVKAKYGLKEGDLDLLLFLSSEGYFSRDKFTEFQKLLSWNKFRFYDLIATGWIEVFRKKQHGKKNMYNLSDKAKKVVSTVYNILNGDEISVKYIDTTVFKRNVAYTDKLYKDFIENMTKNIREKKLL